MERKYYPVNEETAKTAKEVNSFTPYKEGEATKEYQHYCDKAYDILDSIAEKRPQYLERAEAMTDRYCKKLAEYYNDYYRNEAYCPSVLISGAGNFPVRKKEKQNARRDTLRSTWAYLQGYLGKIENLLTYDRPIMCGDENAMEALQDKIDSLEKQKELAKDLNKFFRKGGKIEDYDGEITNTLKKEINFLIRQGYDPCISTTNMNAEIRRLKERLKGLQRIKAEGTTEATTADEDGNELFKVIKNTEIMRLQLIFDGKPTDEVREILKKNGFKWSPKNGAWQRQLTDNALHSLKRVNEEIKACNRRVDNG